MNVLGEAFAKAAASRKDAEWIGELGKVVKLALWPFDGGNATISRYETGSFGYDLRFRIELEAFPDLPFEFVIDERQIYQAYYPEQFLFDSMKLPLFNHFRYRPSLPVDDHIVLGEE